MKKASISDAKNNFSALIDRVKAGASILIVDRGHPVARLEPITGLATVDDSRLSRLVRDGVVRPATGTPAEDPLATRPPRARKGGSVLQALLDERRESR